MIAKPLNYDPTDPDKMRLPTAVTCGDCVHIYRCKAMFGHTETDTYCDWSPSRFRAATKQKSAASAEDVIGCSCRIGLNPWRAHATDCPVHMAKATLIDPYDGGSWVAGRPGDEVLSAQDAQAEIARLSAALDTALAQLEAERARNVLPRAGEPRHPFSAKLHSDWIVIAVSLDTLRHATETSPRLEWYPHGEHQPVMPVVTDLIAFADEFVGTLNMEGEDGTTLVTAAFDKAIERAIEHGANGVEVAEAARDLLAARAAIIPGDAS